MPENSKPTVVISNLERAKDVFNRVDKNHMHLIREFYEPDAEFQDPLHKIRGVDQIEAYYSRLYKYVKSISFDFKAAIEIDDLVTIEWTMHLRTPVLNAGRELTLDGISLLNFNLLSGKVVRHRDYFDMGEFIYERVPVLKSLISFMKKRMTGK